MSRGFEIFNIHIQYYSLFILLGVILAYIIIMMESKKLKINSMFMDNVVFYGLLFGILGARIHYVLFNLDFYLNNLSEIIKIWHGGLAIHGGIIFGSLFVYFYSKKYKESFIKLTDIILPGVILAQGIGRWGNFFNQEAFGSMVSKELLEKLFIPKFIINGMHINGNYYLPTFYIESILCILGFIIMLIIRRNKNIKRGYLTSFYLIWYGIVRLFIEYFRLDSLMLGSIKVAMLISFILIILGIVLLFISKKKNILYKEN